MDILTVRVLSEDCEIITESTFSASESAYFEADAWSHFARCEAIYLDGQDSPATVQLFTGDGDIVAERTSA